MAARIATVTGRLMLTVGDGEPIDLRQLTIPIEATASVDNRGELVLSAKTNMHEVRDLIEQVFHNPDYQNTNEETN